MRQMKKEIFGYKSFEDLFNQYFEDLMRFVYGYVGNEEVARDIVHDVFLTFWNHREHLDFSWSLKSYLFTLSRNYALNYLRHQKVVAQNEEALMREMESIQDEWEDYDQKIERLQAGLAALPDVLEEIAMVRLKNPDVSLKELGVMLSPPLGKSGVNHRLKRISEIATELRDKEETGNDSKRYDG